MNIAPPGTLSRASNSNATEQQQQLTKAAAATTVHALGDKSLGAARGGNNGADGDERAGTLHTLTSTRQYRVDGASGAYPADGGEARAGRGKLNPNASRSSSCSSNNNAAHGREKMPKETPGVVFSGSNTGEEDDADASAHSPLDASLKVDPALLYRNLWLFIWLKAIGSYDSGAFSAAIGTERGISEEWGLSFVQQGTLASSVFLGNIIGCPLAGHLFSQYSEKKVLNTSLILHTFATFLFASFTEYHVALVHRFFIGLTLAFVVVYTPVWVHEFAPKDRQSMWMASHNAGVPLGILMGYMAAAFFPTYTSVGWQWAFYLKCVMMVPTILYITKIDTRSINTRYRGRARDDRLSADGAGTAAADSGAGAGTVEGADERAAVQARRDATGGPGGATTATVAAGAAGGPLYPMTVASTVARMRSTAASTAGDARTCLAGCSQGIVTRARMQLFGVWASTRPLLTNTVYLCAVLAMSSLYFVATGLQNYVTQYLLAPPFNASMHTLMAGFGASIVTAPVLGVVAGGMLLDKIGGYQGNLLRVSIFALTWGTLAAIFAVVCIFVTSTVAFLAVMSVVLFCGGAIIPPGAGLTMASLPDHLRSFGAAFSQLMYNTLGNFSGPMVCGIVAKHAGLKYGVMTLLLSSVIGLLPMSVILFIAMRQSASGASRGGGGSGFPGGDEGPLGIDIVVEDIDGVEEEKGNGSTTERERAGKDDDDDDNGDCNTVDTGLLSAPPGRRHAVPLAVGLRRASVGSLCSEGRAGADEDSRESSCASLEQLEDEPAAIEESATGSRCHRGGTRSRGGLGSLSAPTASSGVREGRAVENSFAVWVHRVSADGPPFSSTHRRLGATGDGGDDDALDLRDLSFSAVHGVNSASVRVLPNTDSFVRLDGRSANVSVTADSVCLSSYPDVRHGRRSGVHGVAGGSSWSSFSSGDSARKGHGHEEDVDRFDHDHDSHDHGSSSSTALPVTATNTTATLPDERDELLAAPRSLSPPCTLPATAVRLSSPKDLPAAARPPLSPMTTDLHAHCRRAGSRPMEELPTTRVAPLHRAHAASSALPAALSVADVSVPLRLRHAVVPPSIHDGAADSRCSADGGADDGPPLSCVTPPCVAAAGKVRAASAPTAPLEAHDRGRRGSAYHVVVAARTKPRGNERCTGEGVFAPALHSHPRSYASTPTSRMAPLRAGLQIRHSAEGGSHVHVAVSTAAHRESDEKKAAGERQGDYYLRLEATAANAMLLPSQHLFGMDMVRSWLSLQAQEQQQQQVRGAKGWDDEKVPNGSHSQRHRSVSLQSS